MSTNIVNMQQGQVSQPASNTHEANPIGTTAPLLLTRRFLQMGSHRTINLVKKSDVDTMGVHLATVSVFKECPLHQQTLK